MRWGIRQNLTLNGTVSGSGTLSTAPFNKAGLGTLTLTAANPYTGTVLIGDARNTNATWDPFVRTSAPQAGQTGKERDDAGGE